MRPGPKSTAPYAGITRDPTTCRTRQWRAQIWIPEEKRQVNLGNFRTPEEAARAYDAAVREHRPDLDPNFPEAR